MSFALKTFPQMSKVQQSNAWTTRNANPGLQQQSHRSLILAGTYFQRSFSSTPAQSRSNEISWAGMYAAKCNASKDGGVWRPAKVPPNINPALWYFDSFSVWSHPQNGFLWTKTNNQKNFSRTRSKDISQYIYNLDSCWRQLVKVLTSLHTFFTSYCSNNE